MRIREPQELALGSLRNRGSVLRLLSELPALSLLTHSELLFFVEHHHLWSRGLSAVDGHLLGSVMISKGTQLWTRDKRLQAAASDVGAAVWTD